MTKDINISQLATAVMWWLSYTAAIGRDYVLSESAIKFPVAEYLERSTTDKIKLEYGHPKLSLKRFDLFFKTTLDENVVEFKYIKNGSTRDSDEKQRVFNDLMRLHLFLETNHKGYFLICGSQREFISDFQTLLLKPKGGNTFITPQQNSSTPRVIKASGFYADWFSFDSANPKKVIDLKNSKDPYLDIYKNFYDEHKDPYLKATKKALQMPDKFATNLVFLSGDIAQTVGLFQPSKIGIWEIIQEP